MSDELPPPRPEAPAEAVLEALPLPPWWRTSEPWEHAAPGDAPELVQRVDGMRITLFSGSFSLVLHYPAPKAFRGHLLVLLESASVAEAVAEVDRRCPVPAWLVAWAEANERRLERDPIGRSPVLAAFPG